VHSSDFQPTTNHILTGCSTVLDQGRRSWYHDSVLQVFVHGLQKNVPPHYNLYSDLPGHLASTNPPTVPPNLSLSFWFPVITPSYWNYLLLPIENTLLSREVTRCGPLLSDLES